MAALVPEGGQIELVDGTAVIRDQVAFGDAGGAPLPPLTGGYSCCRAPNGSDTNNDATDWTLDPSDSFALVNNAPSPILGGHTVKSNEAGTAGAAPSGAFVCSGADLVELYNSGGGLVSLTGWTLTDGRDVMSLTGFSVGAGSVTVISGFPANFCFEETQVLYLFDNLGRRVDQWGFAGSGLPNSTVSWQRFPDGSGPYNGYDFLTSGGGSTVFVAPQSFGFLNGNTPPLPTTPTMSEWGLIVLSLAVLATGMVASRRRRTTAG
jgi:hypothetical protein